MTWACTFTTVKVSEGKQHMWHPLYYYLLTPCGSGFKMLGDIAAGPRRAGLQGSKSLAGEDFSGGCGVEIGQCWNPGLQEARVATNTGCPSLTHQLDSNPDQVHHHVEGYALETPGHHGTESPRLQSILSGCWVLAWWCTWGWYGCFHGDGRCLHFKPFYVAFDVWSSDWRPEKDHRDGIGLWWWGRGQQEAMRRKSRDVGGQDWIKPRLSKR